MNNWTIGKTIKVIIFDSSLIKINRLLMVVVSFTLRNKKIPLNPVFKRTFWATNRLKERLSNNGGL